MGHPWTIQSVDITHKFNLLLRLVEAFKVGAGHTRYLELLQKGFGFVCSCSFLLMLLTKHHVLMILWVFTYVPIAAQAVSPWAGSQGSPEFGDVWGAIHHLRDADHTVLYVYVYTRMCIVYTYTHSVGVIRGHCGSTHESQLLYKSPTPKHLLIGEIIQNKINTNDGTKKHGKLNTHMKHKDTSLILIIFWS